MSIITKVSLKLLDLVSPYILSDELVIRIRYRILMHKKLCLDDPKTYNEKLQWIKLYDRRPIYTTLVDKYAVKEYVASKIGKEFIIPTYGIWDSFDSIDFDSLPDSFVLKCTHDSGSYCLCPDKSCFDFTKAKKRLDKALRRNYYSVSREWPYKNVPPRIIAEMYMKDEHTPVLNDYKFFCFDGTVKYLFIATGRGSDTRFDFFDDEFHHLDLKHGHKNADTLIEKPSQFGLMKRIASKLSEGLPQVRVDLYEINGRVFFGEYTFFHWGGTIPFDPESWDAVFGESIKLPMK